MNVSLRQSKKMFQMIKEFKGEFLYFRKDLRTIRILLFDDNDSNSTLLVLKYKVKKPLCCIKRIKNR